MERNKNIFFIIALFYCCIVAKPAYAIRIGLQNNVKSAYVATSQPSFFADATTGERVLSIFPMQRYNLTKNGSNITVNVASQRYNLGTRPLVIKGSKTSYISAKNKWYRGDMQILPTSEGLTVVNVVDLETYLKGVVPSEMPSKWKIEAHKAQAIAARSYALANYAKRQKLGFDLKDTPEDQAYGGASSETIQTNYAVESTRGQVLVNQNKIISAYYTASAGGHTVNSGSVWFKDLAFLRPVPSFDGNIPKKGHGVGMSQYGANNMAKLGYNAYQILGYFYQNVSLYTLPVTYTY